MKRPILAALALLLATPALAQPPVAAARASAPSFMPPIVLTEPGPGGMRVAEAGVFGNYFAPPPGSVGRAPGILVLGGSEGGLGTGVTRQARLLAAHGFAVLQLAYFGAPGTPAALKLVPLETFDRGLAWLRAQPQVDGSRLAVMGASKGAEAALLVAAAHPELKAVVAGAPSSVVWNGIDFASREFSSSWSREGAPVAYLPIAFGGITPGGSMLQMIYSGYAEGLKGLGGKPEAAIPVARIRPRMLLICGEADGLWPSCPMARAVKAAAPSARLLAYPGAGHGVFGPPVPPGDPGFAALASLGGTAEGNDAARRQAWPTTLAFLDVALK